MLAFYKAENEQKAFCLLFTRQKRAKVLLLTFYKAEKEQNAFCSLFKGEKVFENPNCSYKKLTLKTSAFSSNTLMVSATICVSELVKIKGQGIATL